MKCCLCGKELLKAEAVFCGSCVSFLEWKYKSLEKYQKARNEALKAYLEGGKG